MKAIEKDRGDRYETAESLAMELLRYLENQPVLARPPSARYRTGKFVRRHKVGVAFAATLAVLLVGVTISQTIQAERIRQARDLADARRGQAEGLIDFVLGDLWEKVAPIGRLEILDDVGDQAMAYFAAIPEEEYSEQELSSRSKALYQIGDVRLTTGNAAEAVVAFRESLRLAKELSARDPWDLERLYDLSQSHFYVGYADWLAGNLSAAETEFQAYLELAETLVQRDGTNEDYQLELAYAHSNIGSVREALGDLQGALGAFSMSLAINTDLVDRNPEDLELRDELAAAHNLVGVVYRKLGQYDIALERHRQEYDLRMTLLESDPSHTGWRYDVAWAHYYMGELQLNTGDDLGALRSLEESIAMLDDLSASDPVNNDWRRAAAQTRALLGVTLGRLGHRQESLLSFRRALSDLESLMRSDEIGFEWPRYLGSTHSSLARALVAFEEPEAALEEAQKAETLLGDASGERQAWRLARSENELVMGHAFFGMGREREAREAWNRALAAVLQGVDGPGGTEFRPMLAEAYIVLDRADEARRELEDLWSRGYGDPYLRDLALESGIVP